eukprot:CAMPEP_0177738514 /NCGR_PEP_ID=MMETSP0484_2-20121128/26494_1 /TAXON_ID=354590 /ORGANISM="Rhodomonas lens, Strain RHODO" /LENGTH=155 /DNA_ID=CAMNT_0019252437 /DNA_START=18 /DNA_END=482 /DNA_ORIENTATION=+
MARGFPLTASDFAEFIRYVEGGLMGFMCLIFIGDMGRGNISQLLRAVYGYPQWFVPLIGMWQGGITVATFGEGGKYQQVGQHMLAFLMGGCAYTHLRRGTRKKEVNSALVLLAFTILLPYLQGRDEDMVMWAAKQLGLAAVGFGVGEIMGKTVME